MYRISIRTSITNICLVFLLFLFTELATSQVNELAWIPLPHGFGNFRRHDLHPGALEAADKVGEGSGLSSLSYTEKLVDGRRTEYAKPALLYGNREAEANQYHNIQRDGPPQGAAGVASTGAYPQLVRQGNTAKDPVVWNRSGFTDVTNDGKIVRVTRSAPLGSAAGVNQLTYNDYGPGYQFQSPDTLRSFHRNGASSYEDYFNQKSGYEQTNNFARNGDRTALDVRASNYMNPIDPERRYDVWKRNSGIRFPDRIEEDYEQQINADEKNKQNDLIGDTNIPNSVDANDQENGVTENVENDADGTAGNIPVHMEGHSDMAHSGTQIDSNPSNRFSETPNDNQGGYQHSGVGTNYNVRIPGAVNLSDYSDLPNVLTNDLSSIYNDSIDLDIDDINKRYSFSAGGLNNGFSILNGGHAIPCGVVHINPNNVGYSSQMPHIDYSQCQFLNKLTTSKPCAMCNYLPTIPTTPKPYVEQYIVTPRIPPLPPPIPPALLPQQLPQPQQLPSPVPLTPTLPIPPQAKHYNNHNRHSHSHCNCCDCHCCACGHHHHHGEDIETFAASGYAVPNSQDQVDHVHRFYSVLATNQNPAHGDASVEYKGPSQYFVREPAYVYNNNAGQRPQSFYSQLYSFRPKKRGFKTFSNNGVVGSGGISFGTSGVGVDSIGFDNSGGGFGTGGVDYGTSGGDFGTSGVGFGTGGVGFGTSGGGFGTSGVGFDTSGVGFGTSGGGFGTSGVGFGTSGVGFGTSGGGFGTSGVGFGTGGVGFGNSGVGFSTSGGGFGTSGAGFGTGGVGFGNNDVGFGVGGVGLGTTGFRDNPMPVNFRTFGMAKVLAKPAGGKKPDNKG